MTDTLVTVTGGCHCGAVRYAVQLDAAPEAHACNCSICAASGFVGIIVPARQFRLQSDPGVLTDYRFNTGVASHLFCSRCGIKSFYRPRSNPDGVSVNLHCLSLPDGMDVRIVDFDGQNWEANAGALKHLTDASPT